jgi:signal transduction histidine kinase
MPVLAVVVTAIGGLMISERSLLPLSAMLGLAGFTVAVQVPRRTSIAVLIGAEALFGMALGIAWARGGSGALGAEGIQSFLPLGAAWFVGDSVAARRTALVDQAEQQLASEAERAGQAIREERVRIARELHDILAHSLAVITVQAGVGRRLMAKRPEEASSALESIEATGRAAQDELRVVLGLLRDDDDDSAELTPAPALADVGELVDTVRIAGTPVELLTTGTEHQLSPALQLSVYRIIQEALTNVVKYAPGAHATVSLAVSAREVRIEVADDGDARSDQPPGPTSEREGRPETQHGIVGMQERVGAFGGSLVAEKVPGHGFRIVASIPLKDEP